MMNPVLPCCRAAPASLRHPLRTRPPATRRSVVRADTKEREEAPENSIRRSAPLPLPISLQDSMRRLRRLGAWWLQRATQTLTNSPVPSHSIHRRSGCVLTRAGAVCYRRQVSPGVVVRVRVRVSLYGWRLSDENVWQGGDGPGEHQGMGQRGQQGLGTPEHPSASSAMPSALAVLWPAGCKGPGCSHCAGLALPSRGEVSGLGGRVHTPPWIAPRINLRSAGAADSPLLDPLGTS
jgi:hypothetical protein